jgi:hypothetical protein
LGGGGCFYMWNSQNWSNAITSKTKNYCFQLSDTFLKIWAKDTKLIVEDMQ